MHGVNQFFDVCPGEFQRTYLTLLRDSPGGGLASALAAPLTLVNPIVYVPTTAQINAGITGSVDWRSRGAVTAVKDQGACGSCWAFSSISACESQWKISGHPLTAFSEQDVVSCNTISYGCSGGYLTSTLQWIVSKNVTSMSDYPYTSSRGVTTPCNTSKMSPTVAYFRSVYTIPNNEFYIAAYVLAYGPVAVAVDATSWQYYSSGILSNCIYGGLNHGVTIVGFGTQAGVNFWIIKNSWSANWGESGYIRVRRGFGECGIGMQVVSIRF